MNQDDSSLQYAADWTGNTQSGTLGSGQDLCFAQGSAGGRVQIGHGLGAGNTLIEGSWTSTGAPDIDVSMVDGFSVPIVCADNTGTVVTGCNIELGGETDCNSKGGTWNADLQNCLNPAGGATNPLNNGPPVAYFAPCAGKAYTYPEDGTANVDNINVVPATCCVGSSCPPYGGHLSSKKVKRSDDSGIEDTIVIMELPEPMSRRDQHKHGGAHGRRSKLQAKTFPGLLADSKG